MRTAENRIFESNRYALDFVSGNNAHFTGVFDSAVRYILENQLLDRELWARFVRQYTYAADRDGGWKCEYWGKMMRGACFICSYTMDAELYAVLEETVRDMLNAQDALGRFSTYPADAEFRSWDMWGRKYILLGFLYFYEICDDEALRAQILTALCRHADYICARVGRGEGKVMVCETSGAWLGVNSMSILEPFVKLYRITHEQRYLDFAAEIVREGYEEIPCIFRLAEEDKLNPFEYPENKAYETMSCFDGLAEYYTLTGDERYRKAVINFGRRVLETDVTVIGSCGCTHELFDHSAAHQVDDARQGIMQETCVTVTLIKLCGQLLRLTGDMRYMECIETAFFNAYLGALNTHHCPYTVPGNDVRPAITMVMPFDSYAPLRAGMRGQVTGGCNVMADGTFYGCCACIASAGAGYLPKVAVLTFIEGILLTTYLPGRISAPTPGGQTVTFTCAGNYPYESHTAITLEMDYPETFALDLRLPAWSRETAVRINGESCATEGDRLRVTRRWQSGDTVTLDFDVKVYPILPEKTFGRPYVAFRYGVSVLAADERLGTDFAAPVLPVLNTDGSVSASPAAFDAVPDAVLGFNVQTESGVLPLIDYASAGKDYGKRMAAWLLTTPDIK